MGREKHFWAVHLNFSATFVWNCRVHLQTSRYATAIPAIWHLGLLYALSSLAHFKADMMTLSDLIFV
jgi:hypothetical protein